MHIDEPIIFSTSSYSKLAQSVSVLCGAQMGKVEVRRFPDGERYMRLLDEVDGRDVVVLGGSISDEETLELYDLACGVVNYGAHRLTLVIPYFGYSTMERAVRTGEIVTAKNRARLLSSIPASSLNDRVMMLDLHSEGIPHYFESNMRAVHLYAKGIILDVARQLGGDDFILACTDAGRAKWVESLANDLGVPAAFVFKRRISGSETAVTGINAEVKGRKVVIYDDMIRTGGSLMSAARAYLQEGAVEVSAVATHGLFPGGALERIRNSNLFTKLVCTDSHPRPGQFEDHFLEVRTVAPILAQALRGPSK